MEKENSSKWFSFFHANEGVHRLVLGRQRKKGKNKKRKIFLNVAASQTKI